jgi:hypothetical protein
MSLTFPASPTIGDTYTVGSRTWTWSGTIWEITGTVAAAGSIGTAELAASAVTSAKIAASPSLTGTPLAPTAAGGTNTTQIATTEFVTTALSGAAITALDDVGDVTITSASSGQLLKWNGTAWVNASFPKTHVTKYTSNTNTSWTCPAGVTQIKLTLIGAGGPAGDSSAITEGGSSSQSTSAGPGASTTFTAGGTTYTALGGVKGLSHTVTGDNLFGLYEYGQSSSFANGSESNYNAYPGRGMAPLTSSVVLSINGNGISSRAFARSLRGQDGVTEVFQVTVVPATTYNFSIGNGTATGSSDGAVIIEYVV